MFFGNHLFVLKTQRNAMKHIILSFKMKGVVISDHFLMLWLQKDSSDIVGFRTLGLLEVSGVPKQNRGFW